jgi:chromosome segregation ATPase
MAMTSEQIIQTAEALVARGESPTLAAVRRELGGGSYTTISEALKGWRARRQAAQARAETVAVPARVQEALAQAGVLVWTEAMRQHAAQISAEREALGAERERFEAERREALEVADQVSRELDQIRGERDQAVLALAQERERQEPLQAEVREQRALAAERGRRAEALEGELRELRRQAGELSVELGQVRGQLEALQDQLRELRQAQVEAEAERDQARAALLEAQGQAREQDRRRQELEAALDAARTAQATAERTAGELRLEVATLTERAAQGAELRTLLVALQGQIPQAPAPRPTKKVAPRRRGQTPTGDPGNEGGS